MNDDEYYLKEEGLSVLGQQYLRYWACEPPEVGQTFQVLKDEWKLDGPVPIRIIRKVEVK